MGTLDLYIVFIAVSILSIKAASGCQEPYINNGYFETTVPYVNYYEGFPPGSIVTFFCDDGYNLVGNKVLKCLRHGWSGKFPKCVKADPCSHIRCKPPKVCKVNRYGKPECVCPGSHYKHKDLCVEYCSNPPNIANGGHNGNPPYNYPDKIQYYCNKYYELEGKETYICQKDGTWYPTPPPTCVKADPCSHIRCKPPKVCKVNRYGKPECVCPGSHYKHKDLCFEYCSNPPNIANGGHNGNPPYNYPDKIRYYCNRYYELEGEEKYTCQKDGTWYPTPPPTCVKRKPVCKDSCKYRCYETYDSSTHCCQCGLVCKYLGKCCADHEKHCPVYYGG